MRTPETVEETSDDLKLDQLLSIAALFEGPFSIDWIIQLTGCRVSETLHLLKIAVKNDSLSEHGNSTYVFRDKRLRKSLRASLRAEDLRQLHEKIAGILMTELPDDAKKPIELSAHLLHAENDPDRCRWLYKAGEQYLRDYRIGKALQCFSKIFDDLSRHRDATTDALFIDTAIGYAKHASIRYNIDKVVTTLKQAIANAETIGDNNKRPILYLLMAHNEWLRGDFEAALDHFETGRRLSLNIESSALRVYAVTFSVYFYYWQGLFGRAVEEYEQNTSSENKLPDGRFPYFPGILLGFCYAQIGQLEHGLALIDHVRRRGIERGSHFLTIAATIIMACVMLLYQKFEEAIDYIDTASAAGEKAGIGVASSFCNLAYAYAYYQKQQFEKASECLNDFWEKKDEHEQVIQWLYPILLDLAWGIYKGDLPPVKGLDLSREIQKAMGSKNLFYRGYGYRFEAFCIQNSGESRTDIIEALKHSVKYMKESGSLIEQAKTLAELMTHYPKNRYSEEFEKNRTEIRRLLSGVSPRFIPKNFLPFLDRTHADSLIVSEFTRLGRRLKPADEPLVFLSTMLASANHMIGAERSAIILKTDRQDTDTPFEPLVLKNLSKEIYHAPSNRLLRDLIARGADTPEGIIVFPGREAIVTGSELPRSALCVPLTIDGRTAGVLYMDNRLLHDAFTEKDLQLLHFFSAIASHVLQGREARKSLERYKRKHAAESIEAVNLRAIDNTAEDPLIVGQSDAIRSVLQMIDKVAETNASVLILGETGVGKELVARSIHRRSLRSANAFISVNCNAIPKTIIGSELFGHEKGAFTGASKRRIGRFELADRGTLFLDEIGDLPIDIQIGLLRILQTRQFERIGSSETLSSNFRLIAATNRDLHSAVREGKFREDLLYRLNIFPIHVPPLRERKSDIPMIAHHLLKQYAETYNQKFQRFPQSEMDKLMAHEWPGNVRELENVIQRGVILGTGPVFKIPDILSAMPDAAAQGNAPVSLNEMERAHIIKTLDQTHWKIRGKGGAAELLDIHPSTLRSRMKKLGITRPSSL